MSYAPIALFVYNRLWHTRQTVEALLKNAEASQSDLIVFSDGPRDAADEARVRDMREFLDTISGFRSVEIIRQERNVGLARSIISGVTRIVGEHGRIIVLEDDLVTSPYFLRYMNDALDRYEDDDRVACIHGYSYPIDSLSQPFFLKGADCWGWATWARGWALFEEDGQRLLDRLQERRLLKRFDLFGAYDFSGMLRNQIAGRNQSWAVRWYGSALLHDKLVLYPGRTLVRNIGLDGSGTHCGDMHGWNIFDAPVGEAPVDLDAIAVEESSEALAKVVRHLRQMRPGLFRRMARRVQRMLQP